MVGENNTNNTEPEQLLESDAIAPQETTEENVKKDEGSSSIFGSATGLFMAAPVGIYSYINSPSRYSAEKLEKKAYQYASKQVNAAKKSKRELTPEEHTAIYDKALLEYYGKFVRGYRNKADQLAQGSSNKYLLAAIENENNRKIAPLVTKSKIQSKADIPTSAVPTGNENVQKNLSGFGEKIPSTKLSFGGITAPRVSPVSGPSIPSAPNNAPARQNQRRGAANPLNQLSNDLSSLKNAVNIARSIWASPALGVFIFIIALCGFVGIISGLLGGAGGGSTGGESPVASSSATFTFEALGDSLTEWPNKPAGFIPNPSCASNNSCDGAGPPWPSALANEDSSLNLIKNSGNAGYTTTQILSVFETELESSSYTLPDVLFLQGGTNDTSSINTIANLKAIITDAKNAGIKYVILLTITHKCSGTTNLGPSALNNPIKALASNYVAVIDVANVLDCSNTPPEYQIDGIHYTSLGAQKIADYIDGQIKTRNILPTPTPTQLTQTPSEAYYCQGDGALWASTTYDSGTYASAGCGPTSMAMILSSYGHTQTPNQIGVTFTNSPLYLTCGSNPACPNTKLGYCTCQGTWSPNLRTLATWLTSIGFQTAGVSVANGTFNFASAETYLEPTSNYLLYVGVTNWPLLHGPGGHSFVVESVDPATESLTIRDPANCTKKIYTINQATAGEDAHGNSQALDWIFAIPIKLK